MNSRILLIFLSFILSSNLFAKNEPKIVSEFTTITEKGAWCWFADPRAVHYQNKDLGIDATYIGYIDVHGAIKALQIDHKKKTKNEVLIRSCFQPDDHNNPTFLALPDGRIMIFYSRHTDEACFYYRVSQKPGNITTLGPEIKLLTENNTTYPSPFILSDDPDHIYLCWRGIKWHPTIARLSIPKKENGDIVDFDWGPLQIVQSTGARPYAKYASNGKDKIFMTYTTGHPDNEAKNFVYFNYIDINDRKLKEVTGTTLSVISDSIHQIAPTEDYTNRFPNAVVDDSAYRNWVWEVSADKIGNPVIAMVRISDDKESHDYYSAKWNGKKWQKTFLENGGGHFHQTPGLEKCYSGGMAIDNLNPNILYCSVPEEGKNGKVYELKKYILNDDGDLLSTKQITSNSQQNNVRPYVIKSVKDNELIWMSGNYYDWIVSSARPGFPTAIKANFSFPKEKINLKKGLLKQVDFGEELLDISINNDLKIDVPKLKSFSIVLTLSIDPNNYFGEILKSRDFIYGLESEEFPKPFIEIENKIYKSVNVLGSSDVWLTQNRGTTGKWFEPTKLSSFQLAITYEKGVLKTYIDGLLDQYIEIADLKLQDLILGGFNGKISNFRIYKRAISQDEIRSIK